LFLWAGAADGAASDFLAVIDADPRSARYGRVLASRPIGVAGTHPHHTEAEMPADDHLLANGFHAGRTWLFDLSRPLAPAILTSFGDLAGYSHPHSFIRLAGGDVLATFQYRADSSSPHAGGPHVADGDHVTGGLVEMDERGRVIRSGSARDSSIPDRRIYPYAVLPLPQFDRALSTTTDMNEADTAATAEWVQLWRLSDLTLLRSIALAPGPRGDEHRLTGEPRLLANGRDVYVHTFNCGLYLIREIAGDPVARLVWTFDGKNCGVPILVGHHWLQTVPDAHAIVVLDGSDAEHPKEVSRLLVGDDEEPHWIASDRQGRRLVVNSSGKGTGNRLMVLDFDPSSGRLEFDERFRDAGATRPGISLSGRTWPHGFRGNVIPHGTVFSR
jgi:hypothetical protein